MAITTTDGVSTYFSVKSEPTDVCVTASSPSGGVLQATSSSSSNYPTIFSSGYHPAAVSSAHCSNSSPIPTEIKKEHLVSDEFVGTSSLQASESCDSINSIGGDSSSVQLDPSGKNEKR